MADKIVPTNFSCTLETETERILHASMKTASGFYYFHKFAVLPYLELGNAACVYLPEFDFKSIPSYWDSVKDLKDELPLRPNIVLFESTRAIVADSFVSLDARVLEIEKEWRVIESSVWDFLIYVAPRYFSPLTRLDVRVTSYGTSASFQESSDGAHSVLCYLRQDMGVAEIIEGLLSSLLFPDMKRFNFSWENRESVADFFVYLLVQKGILPGSTLTMKSLKELKPELIAESGRYMHRLGLVIEKPFLLERGQVFFNHHSLVGIVTAQQLKLLKLLVRRSGELISYDQLGDVLWQDDPDSFSLEALTKQMQRLRGVLLEHGVDGRHLEVVRGTGYILHN